MFKRPLLCLFFSIPLITPSYAQEANGLGVYVPPPLFGAPNLPPAGHKADDLGLPILSKEVKPNPKLDPKKDERPTSVTSKPRIIKQVRDDLPEAKASKPFFAEPAPKSKPVTVKKPVAKPPEKPVAKPTQKIQKKIPVKPGPEPIDLLKKKDIPPPPPLEKSKNLPANIPAPLPKKVTSEGVVKGPKTMPSNKKQSVDAEVTFKPKEESSSAMLDRVQIIDEAPKESLISQEELSKIKKNIPLPSVIKQADGSQKLALLYLTTQSDVKEAQINALEQLIIPALTKNSSARLIVEAYASSQDDSLNSARRLALSRALAIREYLLSQKIDSSRIDVRSLGAQSNIQPLDRVELIVIP